MNLLSIQAIMEMISVGLIPDELLSYHVEPDKDSKRIDVFCSLTKFLNSSGLALLIYFLGTIIITAHNVHGWSKWLLLTTQILLMGAHLYAGHPYVRDLFALKELLGFGDLRRFLDPSSVGASHKKQADGKLIDAALVVKILEDRRPMDSDAIARARKEFAEKWELCRKFELADEKWDRYFKSADVSSSQESFIHYIVSSWTGEDEVTC